MKIRTDIKTDMLLYYIRHGEPIYNPNTLTELGKKQAEALSNRLTLCGLDEIYSSSSNRAIETARPAADKLNLKIRILDECNEDYAWIGFTDIDRTDGKRKWFYQIDEIKKLFISDEVRLLGKKWYEHEIFANTNLQNNIERIEKFTYKFIEELGYKHKQNENLYEAVMPNEKKIALFAHEGFGMAFLSVLLDIPYSMLCTHIGLGHSGMTVIKFSGNSEVIPCVLQLSNDSHIYKENLGINY